MSLSELINNNITDKNTTHSYLELYETLFNPIKATAKNILEIGIGDFGPKNGGSIKLWRDYFTNAMVYGIDILSIDRVMDELKNDSRVVLYTSTDGYNEATFKELFLDKNLKFDMLLDDGPHSLNSMKTFIRLYSQVMADNGLLVIEDVQSMNWIQQLKDVVPDDLKNYIEVYDLRGNKNRYDDIVFVINKNRTK